MNRLTIPLEHVTVDDLSRVGGKAVNLGELLRAGFAVPGGFCVTTAAFRQFIGGFDGDVLAALDGLGADDLDQVRAAGRAVRSTLAQSPLPDDVARAVTAAWQAFGSHRSYAVRSSATAEDLPSASFAGQQDTYLNVRGIRTLLTRVRDCFVSLFTDRAILYRLQNGFDHHRVALAVVVQQMVEPEVSGVLFTADPVTGNRSIASIDASYGLGEATVSGIVTADSIQVDRRAHRIVATNIADKHVAIQAAPTGGTTQVDVAPHRRRAAALTDAEALALARLGDEIEQHYGSPQDIEWALVAGTFVVTQTRPITTLFPLPEPAPHDDSLHAWVSFGHLQVMTDAMPPLVTSLWRIIVPVGRRDQRSPSRYAAAAGGRLYLDLSPALRHPLVGRVLPRGMRLGDRAAADALAEIGRRPAFRSRGPRLRLSWLLATIAPYALRMLRVLTSGAPEGTAATMLAVIDRKVADVEAALADAPDLAAELAVCDAEIRRLFTVLTRWVPQMIAGMVATGLLRRLATDDGDVAAAGRGSVGNVVTEMDLQVGDLADAARPPAVFAELSRGDRSVDERLATIAELEGGAAFLAAWRGFLARYGARGTSEIDLSRPRWDDDPTTLLQMVLSAARHGEPGAHRARYRSLHDEAIAAGHRLVAAAYAAPGGRVRASVVRRLLRVSRNLMPLREHHKFLFVRILALVRRVIGEAGECLHAQGALTTADDVWLLTWPEISAAITRPGADLRSRVDRRREAYERDRRRTPPRVMTSDGEVVAAVLDHGHAPDGALVGSAASAGVVEGVARVVRDPDTAILEPGDILVAPFTDPGWTPLFVSAAGLVTEVGGRMTHGSVVAREYGIPAVVCVDDATRRIRTGQRLRVDGDGGFVEVLDGDGDPSVAS